jgi:hypothetical protein
MRIESSDWGLVVRREEAVGVGSIAGPAVAVACFVLCFKTYHEAERASSKLEKDGYRVTRLYNS